MSVWPFPAQDAWLKFEALGWLMVVRLSLAARPFSRTLALHQGLMRKQQPVQQDFFARVEHAVARAARFVPRSECLPQALAGQILLARRGIPCNLRIGMLDVTAPKLKAHAWLEHEGITILGARRGQEYVPLEQEPGGTR